ncbi:MAG: carboxypeptidase regulatory-like domain-containing protein [Terriglobia bacterium]
MAVKARKLLTPGDWLPMACLAILMSVFAGARATAAVQLRGTVVDENGVPVNAVQVTVKSKSGSIQYAYSDDTGHFEVSVPAPGEYLVSLSKPDYFRLIDQAVPLQEETSEASFTLSHEFEVHSSVEVRSSAKQIDPLESEHQEIFDAQDILDLPTYSTHDLTAYLPMIAGVTEDNSGALHVSGGRSGDAEYMLDGFEIGDPVSGELTSRLDIDSVREVKVDDGRYGAQYAHAAGAVMEFGTYVGDDRWRFGTTDFFPAVNLQQGIHLGNWYPRFNFSGPLHKGRAWFSDGISLQHTFSLIQGLPRNGDTQEQWSGDNLARVQMNLTPTNILQGSFLYNQSVFSHLGLSLFTPLSTTTDDHAHREFVSVKDQFFFGRNMFELGAATDNATLNNEPLGSEPYVVQPITASGNYFQRLLQRNHRVQVIGNLNLSSLRWHGTHELKAGFNADELAFSQGAVRDPIETLRADNTLLLKTTFSGAPYFHLDNTQFGYFLEDSWKVLRPLIVSIGGRADWDKIIGKTIFGPRLAASFLPFSDNRTKISVGWGIYYRPINMALWSAGLDQERVDTLYDSTGTTPVLGPATTRFVLPPGGLRQTGFNTTSIELEQKLGSSTFAGVALLRRVESDGFTYQDIQPAPLGGLFLFEDERGDRYRSGEIWVRRVFRNKAEIYADYTRSSTRSNEALDYSLLTPYFVPQAPGRLLWDTPNRLIAWGKSPLPLWQLFLSCRAEYRTGYPLDAVNEQLQLVGAPGQFRYPGYFDLDVGLEKRFHFRGQEWAIRVSSINATNHDNPNAVNTFVSPFAFAGGQRRAFTARLRLVGRK